jgi:hypothetical protein
MTSGKNELIFREVSRAFVPRAFVPRGPFEITKGRVKPRPSGRGYKRP